MAQLVSLDKGIAVPLVAHHLVGRSRKCQLLIDRANVSAVHAEVMWTGRAWLLRDLSTNGTFIDGHRMARGEQVALAAGAQVSFGRTEPEYRLIDTSPPRLTAFGPDGAVIIGSETLYLPSPDDLGAVILQDADGRWTVENEEATRSGPVADGQCIVVRGQPYTVHLPVTVPLTRDPAGPLDEIALEFLVSRDGEHIDIRVCHGGAIRTVEPRAHGPLLHVLARTRAVDARRVGLPEREHGWMHREDLMSALACIDANTLNVWVFRARQQFAELQIPRLAERIIERRELAGQLRLGLRSVTINGA